MIKEYVGIAPKGDLILLQKLGEKMENKSFLHVNSTRAGGGVAEILQRMIPILKELGVDARWGSSKGMEDSLILQKRFIMPSRAMWKRSPRKCGNTILR